MAGIAAFGISLENDGVAVAQVTSISGPSLSADTIDITNHASTDGYREFVQGLKDAGHLFEKCVHFSDIKPADSCSKLLLMDIQRC